MVVRSADTLGTVFSATQLIGSFDCTFCAMKRYLFVTPVLCPFLPFCSVYEKCEFSLQSV